MNNDIYLSLEKTISASRLSTYRALETSTNNTKTIENYLYNSKVSENFYFLLQNLEVTLRNAIYDNYNLAGFSQAFFYLNNSDSSRGVNYIKRKEFHTYACWRMIGKVKYNLSRSKVTLTDGKIISELNFGFWTKLFTDNKYKTLIWRRIFKGVFPNYPHGRSIDSDVDKVTVKLDEIRKFRNRIFHYEPIINQKNLDGIHKDIIEIIGWINLDMKTLNELYDDYDFLKHEKMKISTLLNEIDASGRLKNKLSQKIKAKKQSLNKKRKVWRK